MQNCLAKTASAFSTTGRALSRFASSNRSTGVFPPSSRPNRLRFFAPAAEISRPTLVLPVQLTVGTRGCSITARTPPLCRPEKTFNTPLSRLFTDANTSNIKALVLRRQAGQLADDGATRGERRSKRPKEQHDRRIPGRDEAGNCHRFLEHRPIPAGSTSIARPDSASA